MARTFDENIRAYHRLNSEGDIYAERMSRKLAAAKTTEETEAIVKELDIHWGEEIRKYIALGEEMAKIMNKKWWQFWK